MGCKKSIVIFFCSLAVLVCGCSGENTADKSTEITNMSETTVVVQNENIIQQNLLEQKSENETNSLNDVQNDTTLVENEETTQNVTDEKLEKVDEQTSDDAESVSEENLQQELVQSEENTTEESIAQSSETETTQADNQSFAAELPAAADYSQLVVVESQGTTATVTMHEVSNGTWKEILRTSGFVGSQGVGNASEWSSCTPQGTFPLYFAFGIKPDPGAGVSYLQVDDNDYWVEDTESEYYNQYVRTDTPYTQWNSAEHIIDYPNAYQYCLFIGYNIQGIPGAGSCFFLYCSNGIPTAGCVAVPESDMVFILQHIGNNCGIVIE